MNSTALRSIGYDEAEWVLQLKYVNGKLYNYFRVPPEEYAHLKKAPSKGVYVNYKIKPYYDFEELETEDSAG